VGGVIFFPLLMKRKKVALKHLFLAFRELEQLYAWLPLPYFRFQGNAIGNLLELRGLFACSLEMSLKRSMGQVCFTFGSLQLCHTWLCFVP